MSKVIRAISFRGSGCTFSVSLRWWTLCSIRELPLLAMSLFVQTLILVYFSSFLSLLSKGQFTLWDESGTTADFVWTNPQSDQHEGGFPICISAEFMSYPCLSFSRAEQVFFFFFTRICIIDSQKIEGPLTYQIVATSIWFHIYTASDQGPFMSYTEYFKQEN